MKKTAYIQGRLFFYLGPGCMGVNVEIYLMKLNDFLSDSRIIENENLEIEQRLNTNGELIALSFKEKSRIKFINGFELIINNEFGHIDNEIYEVQEYNYHYNAPNDFFRFESKPEPHINDSNDIHWIYNNNSPFHNSSLEVRRTRLQTEQLNLFIVLNICYEYIVSGKYPVFEENIDYYNCKIQKFRSELR